MAKTKHTHTVVVGLNVGVDDGEVRYEPGDPIPVEHVEQWMIDDGAVEGADVASATATGGDVPTGDEHVVGEVGPERIVQSAAGLVTEALDHPDSTGGDA